MILFPQEKKEEGPSFKSLMSLLRGPGQGFGRPFRANFTLSVGTQIAVNSAAPKYKQFLYGGGLSLLWSNIAQAAEFSTLDLLFDEFYIHKVICKFVPRNKFSANNTAAVTGTPAGAPGELNTVGGTLYYLKHNGGDYSDNSANWYNAMNSQGAKFVDLGSPFTWTMMNPGKFNWGGDNMDQTTSTNAMGWCQFSASNAYGGRAFLATPAASGASVGIGTLLENGIFGDMAVTFHISVRARA